MSVYQVDFLTCRHPCPEVWNGLHCPHPHSKTCWRFTTSTKMIRSLKGPGHFAVMLVPPPSKTNFKIFPSTSSSPSSSAATFEVSRLMAFGRWGNRPPAPRRAREGRDGQLVAAAAGLAAMVLEVAPTETCRSAKSAEYPRTLLTAIPVGVDSLASLARRDWFNALIWSFGLSLFFPDRLRIVQLDTERLHAHAQRPSSLTHSLTNPHTRRHAWAAAVG